MPINEKCRSVGNVLYSDTATNSSLPTDGKSCIIHYTSRAGIGANYEVHFTLCGSRMALNSCIGSNANIGAG